MNVVFNVKISVCLKKTAFDICMCLSSYDLLSQNVEFEYENIEKRSKNLESVLRTKKMNINNNI